MPVGAYTSGATDPSPLPHNSPSALQIALRVDGIEPGDVALRI
jgi:hypothetical protein